MFAVLLLPLCCFYCIVVAIVVVLLMLYCLFFLWCFDVFYKVSPGCDEYDQWKGPKNGETPIKFHVHRGKFFLPKTGDQNTNVMILWP